MDGVYQKIKSCRLCNSEELSSVINLGHQYVVDFLPEKDELAPKAPLEMMRCAECGLVQLSVTVNPDLLYLKFWYRSEINEQMRNALRDVVVKASDIVNLQPGDTVLDIGANDGTLLGWYPGMVKTVGIDPCADLIETGLKEKRIDVGIKNYFTEEVARPHAPYKIITAIAMFYDVQEPVWFLRQCANVLRPEGVLVIQMNYLASMMKNNAVDNIEAEHLTYYSMQTMKRAARDAGLEIIGAEENGVNGGSFRVYLTHKGPELARGGYLLDAYLKSVNMLHQEQIQRLDSAKTYREFGERVLEECKRLRTYLAQLAADGARIYIYGASTRGTVLMQVLNIGEGIIQGCAERDEKKYGLRMMGGTWPKIYPEQYCRERATHFLVLPWHFKESILDRERDWLVQGGKMIFPLPKIELHAFEKSVYVTDDYMVGVGSARGGV